MDPQINFLSDPYQKSYHSEQVVTADAYNLASETQTDAYSQNLYDSVLQQEIQTHTHLRPNYHLHPMVFYYRPPNDLYYYDVYCKAISYNNVIYLLNNSLDEGQLNENKYSFFYRQEYNNQFYQIICEIVPSSSITNYLKRNIHENVIDQYMEDERLVFTFRQKENIKFHLTQYLSQYLLN